MSKRLILLIVCAVIAVAGLYLLLFAFLAPASIGLPSSTSTPKPTFTPEPSYPPDASSTPTQAPPFVFDGSLLLLGGQDNELSVYEMKRYGTPTLIWRDLTGYLFDNMAVSRDGQYALLPDASRIINLRTGSYLLIPPVQETKIFSDSAEFSPNNNYLAYHTDSGLYVYNLMTGKNKIIANAKCENYQSLGSDRISRLCGGLEIIGWADDTTLIYSAFQGTMPFAFTHKKVEPNQLFIVTVDGKPVQDFSMGATWGQVAGNYLVYRYSTSYFILQIDDLMQGVFKPENLGSEFTFLSPSGRYGIHSNGKTLRFEELDTRTDKGEYGLTDFCSTGIILNQNESRITCNDQDGGFIFLSVVWSRDESQMAIMESGRISILTIENPENVVSTTLQDESLKYLISWRTLDAEDAVTGDTTPAAPGIAGLYTIQEGDSLSSIAKKYGISVDDILLANPDLESGQYVGRTIIIPAK